jgi:hypothetical protein
VSEHLREDVLWEALEAEPDGAVAAHLAGCADCRRRLEEATEALAWAQDASVPEPSPLFWQGFRRNVSRRIEQRERWAMVGRVAAVTALAATLLVAVRVNAPAPLPAETALPAWSALPAVEDDTGLDLLRELEGWNSELPLVAASDVASAVIELDDERRALLVDAVKREFAQAEEEDL